MLSASIQKFLYLVFLVLVTQQAVGQSQLPVYRITAEGEEEYLSSAPALRYDPTGELTIADLIDDRVPATPAATLDGVNEARNYYVWQSLVLENQTSTPTSQLLYLNPDADSLWVYLVLDGRVMDRRTWYQGASNDQSLLTILPSAFEIMTPALGRLDVHARLFYRKGLGVDVLSDILIAPTQQAVNHKFKLTAWHSLYAGLMIGISLLSLLTYRLFRERAFVYFSILTVSLAAYFLDSHRLFELVGVGYITTNGTTLMQFFISAIVVSVSAFGISYVKLKREFRVAYYVLVALIVVVVAAQYIPFWLDLPIRTIVIVANVAILTWMVFALTLVIILWRRGHAAARRLIFAIFVMALPGVVYLLQLMFISEYLDWGQVSFELGTLGFSILIFSGLYVQVVGIRNEAQSLGKQSAMKSRFFANISHEFRTPLTLIMGPLEQLLRRHPAESTDHELLNVAYANAKRQLNLINRVLELSRLEADQEKLEAQALDLVLLTRHATMAFSSLAEQREIELSFTSEVDTLPMSLDKVKMEDTLFNLLSNALKYTPAGGSVTVRLHRKERDVLIEVIDTGLGIAKERLSGVFDRFFQVGEGSGEQEAGGSGIGLSLVRELVRLHGGHVYAESEPGQGSTFTIALPLHRKTAQPLTLEAPGGSPDPPPELPDLETIHLLSDAASPTDAPLVLVVEDNPELRGLIRYTLQQAYRIEEAADGDEGITRARKLQPALIISDVMMPGRDGFALCEALKTDVVTSHIPIILLTAKASADARITGLDTGADDYLTKPFNDRELLARVRNLIESRRILRQRYAQSIELKPEEVTTNPVDTQFLQRAMEIVEERMSDETFKVADFARDLQMSSASLNRKLRSLLDQSTNQFIQSVRLQRAADLLAQKGQTVGEVADLTGFSSSAYFIRVFREKYGVTPGSVMKDEEV